jgi:protein-L-isoaspartate(D-aspartate) O-methyltransferase
MEIKTVRPSLPESYEAVFHATQVPQFMLGLRDRAGKSRQALVAPRLQRAIGVIYRPETEFASHYFQAVLPRQFDSYVWFDQTRAVTPIPTEELEGVPDTYPFGV